MLFTGLASGQGVPDPQQALEGRALVEALRRGGYVIYFRHADTGAPYVEKGVDLARCETQRNLNENGREEARMIGSAFRRLAIPLGQVLASEFCRCRETAQLAFGRIEIEPLLTATSRAPEAASRRERSAQALRGLLDRQPSAGKNDVLVSHGFNLWDAEGFHLGIQGEAAIYRPEGKGGHVLIARVAPRAWSELPGD